MKHRDESERRPRREPDGGGSRPKKRMPPPEATGHEERFYRQSMEGGDLLIAHLDDGRQVAGAIEEFDVDTIRFVSEQGNVLLRKDQIRYIECP